MRIDRLALLGVVATSGYFLMTHPALAQSLYRMGPESRFATSSSAEDATLSNILTRGTTVRVENDSRTPVVLFVAQVSRGRMVTRDQTDPFRLAAAASTSPGVVLSSAVSAAQLTGLGPVRRVGDAAGRYYLTASKPVSAADLTRQTGVSFTALLEGAFDGNTAAPGGGYGGGPSALTRPPADTGIGGAYGGGGVRTADYLVVAVVPADPELRSRATVSPIILFF